MTQFVRFAGMFTPALFSLPLLLLSGDGWTANDAPTREPAQVIGLTTNGCIAGANTLPLEGEGYLVMHLERKRYYGHPSLIKTIEGLGEGVAEQGIGKLQVGDLGMARGGPMPFGHRSHQSGLDVDVWFNLNASLLKGLDVIRANIGAPSLLTPSKQALDRSIWSNNHIALLEMAAKKPGVDRIFVNPDRKSVV
jgi:penicillin-insensitive murein endopeptidase